MLETLHAKHPTYTIGQHLATALDGYRDLWPLTDEEVFISLERYACEMEYDSPHKYDEKEISKIVSDGMHIRSVLIDEEENNKDENNENDYGNS